ncbi:hypothetical protein Sjap_021786 [Stephania japonica]|uniref:Uncharacterized protein n=1 Tax=Stephania japonica TaxID=461633 RepID=A0AAP0EN14_9MAGN
MPHHQPHCRQWRLFPSAQFNRWLQDLQHPQQVHSYWLRHTSNSSDTSGKKNFQTVAFPTVRMLKKVIDGSRTGIGCFVKRYPEWRRLHRYRFAAILTILRVGISIDAATHSLPIFGGSNFMHRTVAFSSKIGVQAYGSPTSAAVVVDWALEISLARKHYKRIQNNMLAGEIPIVRLRERARYHCLSVSKGLRGTLISKMDAKMWMNVRSEKHSCVKSCNNTKGGYNRYCPSGYDGNGVNAAKGGSVRTPFKKGFLSHNSS